MADKIAQHLVPKIYLKEFSNINIKNQNQKKVDYNIHIFNKHSFNYTMAGLNRPIFTENRFYDFKIDPNQIIENNLANIENYYTKHMREIKNDKVDIKTILYLSNFAYLQFERIENTINKYQEFTNNISKAVEQIHNDKDIYEENIELSKKNLLKFNINTFYKKNFVYDSGIHILTNLTNFDFIISDSPMVFKMMTIKELKSILIFNNINYNNVKLTTEIAVYYFPLNKNTALISTKILKYDKNYIQTICLDIDEQIHKLNYLMYQNSLNYVYSGDMDSLKYIEKIVKNTKVIKNYIKITMKYDVYNIEYDSYINKNNKLELVLTKKNNNFIKINDLDIQKIEVFNNKNCCIMSQSISIESYIKEKKLLIIKGNHYGDL